MNNYIYAYSIVNHGDEVQIAFPKFPEIISFVDHENYKKMTENQRFDYASDAVITAIQAHITARVSIPDSDDPETVKADGFIALTVQQAMKLELYKLYRANSKSIAEFARTIKKKETSSRRLLDLTYISKATEIEAAINSFGKTLSHSWELRPITPSMRVHRAFQGLNS